MNFGDNMFGNKIDTYLLFGGENRFSFTGAETSFGCVILNEKENIFITDFRYEGYVKETVKGFSIIIAGGAALFGIISDCLKKLNSKNVGFENDKMTISEFERAKAACPDVNFVPAADVLWKKRAIKTEHEIKLIYEAQKMAEHALAKTLPRIKVGVTEREIAAELIYEMMMEGADDKSFDTIVAFGANSAVPHHKTGDKKLEKNDLILIDMGAKAKGYCSDMTRTFCIGEPDERLATIHGIVLEAQQYALKHIKAGMTCHEADSLAREYIFANGYTKEFGHSLGHGVGLEIHEYPRLAKNAEDILLPNMVVTVEPGIYVEGLGGVRIEDMVVVKEGGIQNLTEFDKKISF